MPAEDTLPFGGALSPRDARDWLRRLRLALGFAWSADRTRFVLLFLAEPAGSLFQVASVFGLKLLTDAALAQDADGAIRGAVLVAVAGTALHACRYAYVDLTMRLGELAQLRIERDLMALAGGAAGLDLHERPAVADQLALLRDERHQLAWTANNASLVLRLLAEVVGGAVLLARIHPALALLPLCGIAPFLASKKATELAQRARDATLQGHRLRRHLVDLAVDTGPAKEVRLYALGDELVRRHERVCDDVLATVAHAAWLGALYRLAGLALFLTGYAAAILLVLWRASTGDASPGDIVMALTLAAQLSGSLGGLVNAGTQLLRTLVICGRYLWLREQAAGTPPPLAVEPALSLPKGADLRVAPPHALVPDRLTSGITLDHVSFTYPGTQQEVLSDVSLHLPAGSVVGLVGENGAGKTTLVKLLAGFYQPSAGDIAVDGVPLSSLDITAWRSRVTAAFQDFQRFELLAREAVGVGCISEMDHAVSVQAALERAGSLEEVRRLPAGPETQLGASWEGGVDLSGGQWQKLALARAFMRTAPLLVILDEPAAALDAETEHAVFERFAAAARQSRASGAITLLVSHRFSTVKMADQIVVLRGGAVAEIGPHATLIAQGGPYAELYTLQADGYR